MATINPYIHFNGNAEEALTFYKSVFGGEFSKLLRYGSISSPEFTIADQDVNRIMHLVLPIGNHTRLIASDVLSVMGEVAENDNRNTISIRAESREEADRLFSGLAAGGAIEMPMSDGPLGFYFGMFTDKYGVQWMVEYEATN